MIAVDTVLLACLAGLIYGGAWWVDKRSRPRPDPWPVSRDLYYLHGRRVVKLWLPYGGGFRLPPPRLVQLVRMFECELRGHDWSDWLIDDEDGPGEYIDGDPDAFMPYCSRPSRAGEFGSRVCRDCDLVQTRHPLLHRTTALVGWMKEPCEKSAEATGGAYTGHVPYLAWTEDGPGEECMWCGSRPGTQA